MSPESFTLLERCRPVVLFARRESGCFAFLTIESLVCLSCCELCRVHFQLSSIVSTACSVYSRQSVGSTGNDTIRDEMRILLNGASGPAAFGCVIRSLSLSQDGGVALHSDGLQLGTGSQVPSAVFFETPLES